MADVRSAAEVAAVLRGWLGETFDGPVTDAETPTSNRRGRATVVHMVRFGGASLPAAWRGPLVVRIHQSPRDAETSAREASVQEWCSARDYPTPHILAVFGPGELLALPVQVMERVPGVTMLDALRRQPWRALAYVERLAGLQLRLHAVPTTDWPEGAEPRLAERRLSHVRRVAEGTGDSDLNDALARIDELVPALASAPAVACHGDFHPLNVLLGADRASVIDWTDAALGDRHGDVARTAWLIRYGIPRTAMRRLTREAVDRTLSKLAARYLHAYERTHPLDHALLRRWEALQLVDSWGHAVHATHDTPAPPTQTDLLGIAWLRRELDAALA